MVVEVFVDIMISLLLLLQRAIEHISSALQSKLNNIDEHQYKQPSTATATQKEVKK